jgi:hypothetical protein
MKCGNNNCSAQFSEEEAVLVRGTNRYSNKSVVIAHECPSCGKPLSMRFTREWNAERCACSARVDHSDGTEICSECGKIYPPRGMEGGIKEEWAIPASPDMRIPNSDAEQYWGEAS